jgi:hypothetical protein
MQITTIGLDIAKNVFQVRYRCRREGRSQEVASPRPGVEVFCVAAAVPGRNGGLRHRTLLGT